MMRITRATVFALLLLAGAFLATPGAQQNIISRTNEGWLVGAASDRTNVLLGADGVGHLRVAPGGAITLVNSGSFSDLPTSGALTFTNSGGAVAVGSTQATDPTCTSNCGTSPTVTGTDSEFTVLMGATGSPASGFVITFNGTWAAAPQCVGTMAKAGMASGKLPLTVVTTTTTMTVVTNGTAPANADIYNFVCRAGR